MIKLKLALILICLPIISQAATIKGTVKNSDGEIKDVIVYIEKIEGKKFPPPSQQVMMDQKDLTFVPHVLPVLLGTTVLFPNSDVTRHSVFSPSKTKKFDFGTYPKGTSKSLVCDQAGVISLLCHVHPEMSSFIVVLETPYFAITNEKGFYKIPNIPAGKYKLITWHEQEKAKVQHISLTEKQEININFYLED